MVIPLWARLQEAGFGYGHCATRSPGWRNA
ncbi:hypothetical protein A2U01_0090267, partial [Trifolium medium]|nr:hypothetical protein [Trifolium medium]